MMMNIVKVRSDITSYREGEVRHNLIQTEVIALPFIAQPPDTFWVKEVGSKKHSEKGKWI
jgi:hypothetical protein